MIDILGGWLTIITSVSAGLFNAMTDVTHKHKEDSDEDIKNNGSSVVMLNPTHAGKSKVANTTPKMSIF